MLVRKLKKYIKKILAKIEQMEKLQTKVNSNLILSIINSLIISGKKITDPAVANILMQKN